MKPTEYGYTVEPNLNSSVGVGEILNGPQSIVHFRFKISTLIYKPESRLARKATCLRGMMLNTVRSLESTVVSSAHPWPLRPCGSAAL